MSYQTRGKTLAASVYVDVFSHILIVESATPTIWIKMNKDGKTYWSKTQGPGPDTMTHVQAAAKLNNAWRTRQKLAIYLEGQAYGYIDKLRKRHIPVTFTVSANA